MAEFETSKAAMGHHMDRNLLPFLSAAATTTAMKLHGSILDNLNNAIASAQRLRQHPVYKDTLLYWAELVQEARQARLDPACARRDLLEAAIVTMEGEMAERA